MSAQQNFQFLFLQEKAESEATRNLSVNYSKSNTRVAYSNYTKTVPEVVCRPHDESEKCSRLDAFPWDIPTTVPAHNKGVSAPKGTQNSRFLVVFGCRDLIFQETHCKSRS